MPQNVEAGNVDVTGLKEKSVNRFTTSSVTAHLRECDRCQKFTRINPTKRDFAIHRCHTSFRLERNRDKIGRNNTPTERVVDNCTKFSELDPQ